MELKDINFDIVENVVYDNIELNVLYSDGVKVWERKQDEPEGELYAKFDGASYFISNILTESSFNNSPLTVEATIYIDDKSALTTIVPYGKRTTATNAFALFHTKNSNGWRIDLANKQFTYETKNNSVYNITTKVQKGVFQTGSNTNVTYNIIENGEWKISGTTSATYSANAIDALPLYIGCLNDNGTPNCYFTQYIKEIKIKNKNGMTDELVADYEFVEKDDVVQMHDKITDTYIINSGTGQVTLERLNVNFDSQPSGGDITDFGGGGADDSDGL